MSILDEFRAALEDEIEAARRNEAGSAVPLVNGRRIAQVGGSYQYIFDIENILNLPGDAPGELRVPGRPPEGVTVVSVEGMAITLSVPADLGTVVPHARLQSNMALLMRKLIQRIEALVERSNPVGERVLGKAPVNGSPVPLESVVSRSGQHETRLNKEQVLAVASALGRDTTFIWGPPGTGKTRTIGAIGEQLYDRNRSLLLVAHTNSAVDEAVTRIADCIDPTELREGKVIRVGDSGNSCYEDEKYAELKLRTHTDRRAQQLAEQRDTYKAELNTATSRAVTISRTIELCKWVEKAADDIVAMSNKLNDVRNVESWLETAREKESVLSGHRTAMERVAEAARATQQRLEQMAILDQWLSRVRIVCSGKEDDLDSLGRQLAKAEAVYAETTSVSLLTRMWRRLPSPQEQEEVVGGLRDAHAAKCEELAMLRESLATESEKKAELASMVRAFHRRCDAGPEDVLRSIDEQAMTLAELQQRIPQRNEFSVRTRAQLETTLLSRMAALTEWGLTGGENTDAAEQMLEAISVAYNRALAEIADVDYEALVRERDDLNRRISLLHRKLQIIEEALKKVEELVISKASIVATTLTRAYLRDSIQARTFDTVILDEASMAPIPALWAAAGLATSNAVVVGDFRQLPPIVISESDMALRWLGTDVFKLAGLSEPDDPTERRVDLLEQWRMHPGISMIANSLIYGQRLKDAPDMDHRGETDLFQWYRKEWGHDQPVLMVDTEPVGAWVTSVSRGSKSRASRLNFLSATICVDIAEQLLRGDRPEALDGQKPRIIIVCPYRPHAKLLNLLIREQQLERDVQAGTAHSFQGSEADVVILDTVNDEPHWRVGMFIPSLDSNTIPLLNVALTRAKRRLIVVGDFNYIARRAGNAFLGSQLIPFMRERYSCIDARQVVPVGLSARAARAQATVTARGDEPSADRVVVTQERFYPVFLNDLSKARTRIVIYSPFITSDRLSKIEPSLKAAVERGVAVYVVTKTRRERKRWELSSYRIYEEALEEWGVVVVHKRGMHEKLAFIDKNILWHGSLNPLSFSDTQEIMERRKSEKVVEDYAQTLMLSELLGEYDEGTPSCPICEEELVATEGNEDPFYWTCLKNGCYTRSIDQPRLMNGLIVCANCGCDVEYGIWGNKPAWRCVENRRHRQRISKSHLRLPKMRQLIPEHELERV